jgi:hypothetical protein
MGPMRPMRPMLLFGEFCEMGGAFVGRWVAGLWVAVLFSVSLVN